MYEWCSEEDLSAQFRRSFSWASLHMYVHVRSSIEGPHYQSKEMQWQCIQEAFREHLRRYGSGSVCDCQMFGGFYRSTRRFQQLVKKS